MTVRPDHLWLGNHRALDLVNTTHRAGGERVDLLGDIDALVSWAIEAGLLDDEVAPALDGREAARTLTFVRRLRDALRAALDQGSLDPEPIGALNGIVRQAPGSLHIDVSSGAPEISLTSTDGPAAQLRLDIAAAAVDLFRHDLDRVRRCADAACELMFLDISKSGRRRWCDMATCGNRAKAAAHHSRTTVAARAR